MKTERRRMEKETLHRDVESMFTSGDQNLAISSSSDR